MTTKLSSGLLLYRRPKNSLEVFLVHPGGPFWAKKDLGSWSIPKGEFDETEDPLVAARREFQEETSFAAPAGNLVTLKPLKQPSGKIVHAYAIEADCDAAAIRSNNFSMEWPRGSGRIQEFPEIDRAAWFNMPEANRRILPGQAGFLEQLQQLLGYNPQNPLDTPSIQAKLF